MADRPTPTLTVVMPAYNEAGVIRDVVSAWNHQLETLGIPHEIRVYDDGSRDGTGEPRRRVRAERDPHRPRVRQRAPRRGGSGAVSPAPHRYDQHRTAPPAARRGAVLRADRPRRARTIDAMNDPGRVVILGAGPT